MRMSLYRRATLFRSLCFFSAATVAILVLCTSLLTIHDVQVVPTVSYLFALCSLGSAFGEIAAGRGFGPGARRGLGRCGVMLTFGGLYATFVVPLLKRALTETGADKFFDLSSLAVALIGLALLMLGNLLAEAGSMKAELEQIL